MSYRCRPPESDSWNHLQVDLTLAELISAGAALVVNVLALKLFI